jgi:2-oxoglutarate dehydrogenase complex dehydrogenase (E1) component-like enzyme
MYCGSVGVEFEHITDEAERLWCYEAYEESMLEEVSPTEKIKAL